MKVLLISHFPLEGSGSGVYTKNIAKNLVNTGNEVYIIFPENTTKIEGIEGATLKPVYFKKAEEIAGQLPFNFPCFTTHPRSDSTFADLNEMQLEMYVEAFKVAIEEAIQIFNPDIIHTGHIWVLSEIASRYDIPTIITSHGTDIIGYNALPKYRNYAKQAVERCNKIITISDSNYEEVLKIFPNAVNKVEKILNGYDKNIFYKKEFYKKEILHEILGINDTFENIILFTGRLVEVKGVDKLLEAAKIYETEDILTIIAGDGILREQLEKQAEELRLKNVKFIGNKPQEILNRLYNIADLSVLSSRYEAFGLVVIEALACGTPVVAVDIDVMKSFMKIKPINLQYYIIYLIFPVAYCR